MADTRYADINKQGSGSPADASDKALNPDTQQALDNANNASSRHAEANRLADRSGQ